jgi:hypothetical protein
MDGLFFYDCSPKRNSRKCPYNAICTPICGPPMVCKCVHCGPQPRLDTMNFQELRQLWSGRSRCAKVCSVSWNATSFCFTRHLERFDLRFGARWHFLCNLRQESLTINSTGNVHSGNQICWRRPFCASLCTGVVVPVADRTVGGYTLRVCGEATARDACGYGSLKGH